MNHTHNKKSNCMCRFCGTSRQTVIY